MKNYKLKYYDGKTMTFFLRKIRKKIECTNFNEIGSLDFLCILIWEE